MTLSDRLSRFGLVMVTTIGATFTVLVAGGSGSFESLPIRVIYIAMAALALIPWLVGAIFRPSWRPSSRLMPAIVVILVAFALSTATSRNPRLSIEMFGYAVLLLLVYLLLVTLMRKPEIRAHFERLALLLALVVSGLYLLQVALAWIDWWGLVGRVSVPPLRPGYAGLTLGSPNPVATLVLALGAFALVRIDVAGRARSLLVAALITLVVVTTFLTASRGAWLGAAAGLVAIGLVAGLARPGSRVRVRIWLRTRAGRVQAASAVALVVVAVAVAIASGRVTLEDAGYRAAFLRASVPMIESSPLTGVGPATWGVLRAGATAPADPDFYVPHAHNAYLQTLAETGLSGGVAMLVLIVAVVWLIARAARSDDPRRRQMGWASLFVLVVFATQQLADFLMNVPALLFAIALPVAWLDAVESTPDEGVAPARPSDRWPSRAVPTIAAIATISIVLGAVRIETIAATARQAVARADAGGWMDAASLLEAAASNDPNLAVYWFQQGVAAANAGDYRSAEASLVKSAAMDDYAYAWLDLAAARWQLGDPIGAREALVRAERLGLQRTPVALAAAWLHQQLGEPDAALEAYAIAISQSPALVADPFWTSGSAPSGGLEAVLNLVSLRAPTAMFEVNLHLGRTDDAASIIPSNQSDQNVYEAVLAAWRREPGAWEALQAQAAARPLDVSIVIWCRRVASHRGDLDQVRRYGAWLTTLNSADTGLPAVPRITFGEAVPLPPAALDRYGSIYRREALSAQVVGLLPQITWREVP